ncbi:MAG: hypothetical protein ABSF89_15660 [Acidimicrobiales bacterium]|jgi:hypothetical protein
MDKSFKQQESNSVLGSDRAGEVEGTVALKATGESTGQKSHKRTWWTLTNVSLAALALAMSLGFGVATGEVAGASAIGRPIAPAPVHKPPTRFIVSKPETHFTPKNRQPAVLVSETSRLGTGPQQMRNNNPQHGGWNGRQNGHRTSPQSLHSN